MAQFLWDAPGAWTDAIPAASLSALANNSIAVGSAIDNTTTLAQRIEIDFISTAAGVAVVAGGHLALYILPLLNDGTSYPTNSASGTALPSIAYCLETIGFPSGTVVPLGTEVLPIPYGTFKIGLVNRLGVALATSTTANTLRYRLVYDKVV